MNMRNECLRVRSPKLGMQNWARSGHRSDRRASRSLTCGRNAPDGYSPGRFAGGEVASAVASFGEELVHFRTRRRCKRPQISWVKAAIGGEVRALIRLDYDKLLADRMDESDLRQIYDKPGWKA